MTARELARDVLNRCEKQQQYSNLALDAALKKQELTDADRALATRIVYGVLERKITLDYQIGRLSSRPISEISPEILTLLRMGIYQLAYLDRVPSHAAVNESVALAGKRASGFVNAVLRAFVRDGKTLRYPDGSEELVTRLSVRYSIGEKLCGRLLTAFGEERTEVILRAFEAQPPLTVRVNPLRCERAELLERLEQAGYRAEATETSSSGIRIFGNAAVHALPGFSEGWFFVQDEASQICVERLNAQLGMRVLDTCACPGSKSFGIAMEMRDRGELISCDLHASKLSLVSAGAERLGISILHAFERDARHPCPAWEQPGGQFDRILCDVPCSGFGVIAKKPELRYKDPAVSDSLPDIQLEILRRSFGFLKRGGRLVYSTCTILPEENGKTVERLLSERDDVRLLSAKTFFPDTHGTDGFFVAVLERIK